MRNYERSLDESNTGGQKNKIRAWLSATLVILLIIIFVILAILAGVLFAYFYTMNNDLEALKQDAANSSLKSDISQIWKSVSNIMGDLSKINQKVDTSDDGSCTSCPSGWRRINGNCYYFKSTGVSWYKSRDECATRNGILLVLKSLVEMDKVMSAVGRESYWIGLSLDNDEQWVWTDGTPLSFSAWNEGEPNNVDASEYCTELMGGVQLWNDRNCEDMLGYICKGVWSC